MWGKVVFSALALVFWEWLLALGAERNRQIRADHTAERGQRDASHSGHEQLL